MLNTSKGNMYEFVTHTWNTVKGKCPHDCSYCYMKIFKLNEVRFDKKELDTQFPDGSFVFVGSSCDMFARDISYYWIRDTLNHCSKFPNVRFLFQSKNPKRMYEFKDLIPKGSILVTTIESNRSYPKIYNDSPDVIERGNWMRSLADEGWETAVTIEPILDFDVDIFLLRLKTMMPKFVNIGADSKHHNLPEPSAEKINQLIEGLKKFTTIHKKRNISRLIG